jgi:signal transduction histidine kinase
MKAPLLRTLRAQFFVSLAGMSVLLVAAGVIAVYSLNVAGEATRRLAQERLRFLYDAQQLLDDARQVQMDAYVATRRTDGEPGPLDDGTLMRRLDEMDRVTARLAVSDDVSILDLHQSSQIFRASAQVVARLLRRLPGEADGAERDVALRRALGDMQVYARLMTRAAEEQARAVASAYQASADDLALTAQRQAWTVAAFVAGSLALAWTIAHFILGQRMVARMRVVSECLRDTEAAARPADVDVHVPVEGEDEIADMARAVECSIRAQRDLALARAALEEERGRLAVILDNTADGILTVQGGRLVHANRAALRLFDAGRDALEGRAIDALLSGFDPGAATPPGTRAVDAVLHRADGTDLPVEVSIGEIVWRAGGLSVLVVRDATLHVLAQQHLLAARDAAEAAHAAQRQVFATMNHELRTPLNAVLGYAQLLQVSKEISERDRHQVAIIEDSGRHLLGLINDALDLAKCEVGKAALVIEPMALADMAARVADSLRVKAGEAGVGFRSAIAADLPAWVMGDERRLRQVLLNLLGNALKFTTQGEVSLEVSLLEREAGRALVRFAVADTGCGLTEADQAAIFRPFEQVGDARRRAGGTGLGLAISQQLVGLMGGVIQVRSGVGEGTTFWFDLQMAVAVADGDAGRREVDDVAAPACPVRA